MPTITAEYDPRHCFERTQGSLPTEPLKPNRVRKAEYAQSNRDEVKRVPKRGL
jgi:hypothetical protein